MDNYPQKPPSLTAYLNIRKVKCFGYKVGDLSTMTVYWNPTTCKQEIGFVKE